MRTTVNLDPDAYSFTTAYAGAKGITLSAAINEFVHRAEQSPNIGVAPGRLRMNDLGLLEVVGTGDVITSEMAKADSEDDFE
jgi:hypothetical protein